MSRFTTQLSKETTAITETTSPTTIDPAGKMISATPAIGGAAVVTSAVVAYAVEEAGDN